MLNFANLQHSYDPFLCQNFVSAQYLENDWTEFIKFCIHINIDKIWVGIVKHHFSQICSRVNALD